MKEKWIAAKNKDTALFSSTTNFFSLLNMPDLVQLHGSVEKTWEGINESYGHPVKDQITIMKKTDTYMPTLLAKLLQSQCIVSLNENNLLYKIKVHEKTLATKFMTNGSSEEHTHCCQKWGAKWDKVNE